MFWAYQLNQILFVVSKGAAKCLGLLKRCKICFSSVDLRYIYITYIRPKLKYNTHIWSGALKTAIELLDRVQHPVYLSHTLPQSWLPYYTLFRRYYSGLCSHEILGLVPSLPF